MFEYDSVGNVIREDNSSGSDTVFTYDVNGNLLSWTIFRNVGGAILPATTSYEFDTEGRVVAITSALGDTEQFEYDSLGRESARVDALGRRTVREYDDDGFLSRIIYPDGFTEAFEYDAAGNLVREADRAERITVFRYDALNRLITTIFPDETLNDLSDNPRTQIEYDATGRVVGEIDETAQRGRRCSTPLLARWFSQWCTRNMTRKVI